MSEERVFSLKGNLNSPCKYCDSAAWSEPYYSEGAGGTWWHKNSAGDITMPCAKLWMSKLVPAAALAEKPAASKPTISHPFCQHCGAPWAAVRCNNCISRLKGALEFIAEQENLTFAECSLAEEIVSRAKKALEYTFSTSPVPAERPQLSAEQVSDIRISMQAVLARAKAANTWIAPSCVEKWLALLTGEAEKENSCNANVSASTPKSAVAGNIACAATSSLELDPPAAPPVLQAEPQPITSPEVFSLVQTILAHHQQAYAKFHNAEGHKVIESHNMAIGAASVPLEQWINQRDATIRREAERGMDDLRRDLKFEQDCYANLKGEVVATLQYICDHPPSAEWLKGLNEVREALRALADSPVSGEKQKD